MAKELILTFHGLGEPLDTISASERKVWVPVPWLVAIIDALPRQGVGLAFDDGNISDLEQALPALVKGERSARFFPLASRIGTAGYLRAEDILRLSTAGMRIGSHGLHHRDWRTLGDHELREELTISRQALAGIVGDSISDAACPFGSYDRRVLRALRDAGYRKVFNSDGGTGSTRTWLTPRTTVHRNLPLKHWVDLATTGPHERPSPLRLSKRLVKRLR
jgi:peptidoglycan/xylan/chitin deacetylase (PgdA/CDA1 family)